MRDTTSSLHFRWALALSGTLGFACAPDRPETRLALDPPPTATSVRASSTGGRCTANALAVGDAHSCLVRTDGTVACWGSNTDYRVGQPTLGNYLTPRQVPGISNAVSVVNGQRHSCALLADGTVWCWGRNNTGQLGDGTLTGRATPAPVSGLTGVRQLATGTLHVCALKTDGTVWCWGSNGNGRLGDGTTTRRPTPVQVMGLTGATQVTTGAAHTCALADGGAATYCWGSNAHGQYGDGTRVSRRTATAAVVGRTFRSLAAGQFHTCGVRQDGPNAVECWGRNNSGQLGDGSLVASRYTPGPVLLAEGGALEDGVQLSAGGATNCVTLGDGSARCWGRNRQGQVGNNTTTIQRLAVEVQAPSGLSGQHLLIATSNLDYTCALGISGALHCWGANSSGQLGDGTRTRRLLPIPAAAGSTGMTFGPFLDEDAEPAADSAAASLASDGASRLWAAGRDLAVDGTGSWVVRYSDSAGAAWSEQSVFSLEPGQDVGDPSLLRTTDGTLYLSGWANDASGSARWITRISTDSGESWTTDDDFILREGFPSAAAHLSEGLDGTVFAAGWGENLGGARHGLVRATSPGGGGWVTIDDHSAPGGGDAETSHVLDAGPDGLLAIGSVVSEGARELSIRRSMDGGATWATVSTHRAAGDTSGLALASDGAGRLFALASAASSGGGRWIVRRSQDGGASWTTIDNFQLEAGLSSTPSAVAIDRSGAVHVTGLAERSAGPRGVLRTSFDHGATWVLQSVFSGGAGATGGEYSGLALDGSGGLHLAASSRFGASSSWVVRARRCGCEITGMCGAGASTCDSAPDGTACEDGNLCTTSDTCLAGACVAGTAVSCSGGDGQCRTAGGCYPPSGECFEIPLPDGTGCDDASLCTSGDACVAGTCSGTEVVCAASGPCHPAGTCNPADGTCSTPVSPDGTSCDDGSACTTADACTAGSCAGVELTCTALDQCHVAGSCDSGTGECSNPAAPDGTSCSDGDLCTLSDACSSGACVAAGAVDCSGSPGDQCHQAGACDPQTGGCVNAPVADGTGCDDGNVCTTTDACVSGVCGGTAVADGTLCSDGDACSGGDRCESGACAPVSAVTCAADACHEAGVCDPETGVCSTGALLPACATAAVVRMDASSADGASPGSGCTPGTWTNLADSGLSGVLTGFGSCSATSGFLGAGTVASPYALGFDGTDDRVVIPHAASVSFGTNAHTVSAWIYLETYGSYRPVVAKRSGGTVNYNYHISVTPGDGRMASYNGTNSVGSTGTVGLNAWHHVTWVSSAGTISFYIDGEPSGSATQSPGPANTASVFVGLDNGATPFYFDGNIARVELYDRALSASEVADAFDATRDRFVPCLPGGCYDAAVVRLNAEQMDGTSFSGSGCTPSTWYNLATPAEPGTLNGFSACGAGSGWNGAGTPASPYALAFDGVNDYVSIPHSAAVNFGTAPHTVEAWILLSSYGSHRPIVAKRSGGTVNYNYHISQTTGDGRMAAYNGSTTAGSARVVPIGSWHHVAWVYSSGVLSFFLDGEANGTAAFTVGAANTLAVRIGNDNGATQLYHAGSMADVVLHSRALTGSEILGNYLATRDRF